MQPSVWARVSATPTSKFFLVFYQIDLLMLIENIADWQFTFFITKTQENFNGNSKAGLLPFYHTSAYLKRDPPSK